MLHPINTNISEHVLGTDEQYPLVFGANWETTIGVCLGCKQLGLQVGFEGQLGG